MSASSGRLSHRNRIVVPRWFFTGFCTRCAAAGVLPASRHFHGVVVAAR
jgi:hypothetical protein